MTPRCEITPEFPQVAVAGSPEDSGYDADPTYEQCKPPLFLREISISAENIPALCLNDCPLSPTPLREGRTLASSPMRLRSKRWSMQKTTLKTVKENSQSTDSLQKNKSNTSSQSSSLEKIGSVSDGKLEPATAKQKHSGSSFPSHQFKRRQSATSCYHPSRSELGSPVPLNSSGYKKEEPVLPNVSLENPGGSGCKRGRSVRPVPLYLSGYKREESGYKLTTETIQSNPSTHTHKRCNESGYESDVHSNPNLGSLARRAQLLF